MSLWSKQEKQLLKHAKNICGKIARKKRVGKHGDKSFPAKPNSGPSLMRFRNELEKMIRDMKRFSNVHISNTSKNQFQIKFEDREKKSYCLNFEVKKHDSEIEFKGC